MGSGSGNRRPLGGRLALIVAAVSLLAASFASLYFAFPTDSGSTADTTGGAALYALDPGAPEDGGFDPGSMNENPGVPVNGDDFAPGSSGEKANGGTLMLRAPDGPGEVSVPVTLASGQVASARFDSGTGVPVFLTGSITPPPAASSLESSLAFLDANKDIYRITDAGGEMTLKREDVDELGMKHVLLAQQYNGVPVFGADTAVHFSADGRIVAVNGLYVPGINADTEPGLSPEGAVESAQADLGYDAPSSSFEPPLLMVLAPAGEPGRLVWKLTLVADDPPLRMVYFVDADSGEIVARYDALENAKNRRTYTASNGSSLPGTLLISEGGSSGDSVAQNAHNNTGTTYDYYKNTFNRDSFNNAGATLTSTVHYGSSYNNAFWNGQQMVYGDGDGYVFSPLGNSLDVVAHELTHAVTQYTASLIYSYQSGALNESYSDVFGAMVDRDDWLLGDDVYSPQTPGDALRSLSNPTQYGQPDHMNSYVNTDSDNGGVHTNSGIPNKAAYNIAQAIGKDKMELIWYRALTVYLNSSSQFTDARDASVQAATDLYGGTSAEVTAVQNGFTAVGIGSVQQSETTARIEIDHTYRGDLVVTLGVGDPSSPTWTTTVSNRSGGSANNIYTTVDIAGGAAYLPPNWQNRWFLKVYDAAGYDVGSVKKFTITDHGTTYTAADVPLTVNDYQTVYSYIPTVDDTPPTLSSTRPDNGALTYMNSSINAVFSEGMMASTLNASSFMVTRNSDGAPVSGPVSYNNSSRTATLQPTGGLEPNTAYTATITTAVTDLAGNALADQYQWSFTTRAYVPPYFAWYDYGRSTTGLFLFEATDDGYSAHRSWFSGSGGWDWNRSKTTVSDQNNDGKTELAVFYDYGRSNTGLFLFDQDSEYAPSRVWLSGPGGWEWSRTKVVTAADQNGAGITDFAVLYDYGNDNTGLWIFDSATLSEYGPHPVWISGPGNWDWNRSKILTAADFDGDTETELAVFYDYGNANSGIFLFDPDSWSTPQRVWLSGGGNWDFSRSKISIADQNNDGKAELLVLYDYGHANTGLLIFNPDSWSAPQRVWLSGRGGWEWSRSKIVSGADQNGDGRTELAVIYDYGNANTGLWQFDPASATPYAPSRVWYSGPGGWEWSRTKPI